MVIITNYLFGSDHFALEWHNDYFYVVNTDEDLILYSGFRQECLDYLWDMAATYHKLGITCREMV